MSAIIFYLIFYIVVFIFIFLFQYNFFIKPKFKKVKKSGDEKKIIEIEYLSSKFEIDKNKLLNPVVGTQICYINAFIISSVSMVITLLDIEHCFQFMIGFVLLMIMIYGLYELFGRSLAKKYGKNKKN